MIKYKEWKRRLSSFVCEENRLGDEVFLITNAKPGQMEVGPYMMDITLALIILRGEADIMVNMERYHIGAGNMVVVISNQIFQIEHTSEDLDARMILMANSFTDTLFPEYGPMNNIWQNTLREPVVELGDNTEAILAYFAMMQQLFQSKHTPYKRECLRHLTLAMFYGSAISTDGMAEAKNNSRQEQIYRQFVNEIKRNFRNEREVAFYAGRLCVSPKYLSTVVAGLSGKSALSLINDYVVIECKQLLLSSELSIQQIADKMNFPSQSVFGKFFKRMTGLSPSEYRKG